MALLNNAVGKLTKNADKLGVLAGVISNGIEPLINDVMALVSGQGHFPDIGRTIEYYFKQPEIKPTIMLWLLGYGLGEFGYSKYGKPIQKFSEGMFKGMAVQHVIWWSVHEDQGSRPGGTLTNMFRRVVSTPNQAGYSY